MTRVVGFLVVGAIGFLADAGVLALLLAATSLHPLPARLVSIAVALCVTWLLNRNITFGHSSRGVVEEGARYGGVGIATSLINYAVYSALVLALPLLPPLAALAVASLVATVFSFLGYSRIVFDR
ncbi:GtrA family protein [Mesorhizobium sp. LHD-90]|uniref:GtrA family protein n=1 Tax=Mesorhizobium sp. LHD-90 TaxID=3071414 RepID=UPI0027E05E27|nr:GtrA family protein [Mesorhizobium sp. LHD-90]MDQ6434218.1 GtrA family protein [Mesorhizobium sp. LHD-90]